ncbi:hypothetical protein FB472_1026 [Rhodoglobus vestalii]|uniref:Uncharacterized protein n=1 Tax=Rhodoglobus vestalii TaxID=193384 RepID=A0A8H2K625_9MICO|nr:hypothetical protein [Rhodoglobus vestalii]TQO19473.1 hypothetical protein FB472_1026 [Rhodoglobus vestalii]
MLLARAKNRSAYRMIAKGLPDLDGYQRFKDSNQEDLGNPKKRSGRGFSSNYLATALTISSFNLRSIATFILKLRDKAVEKPLRTRRRKDDNDRPLARLAPARAATPPGQPAPEPRHRYCRDFTVNQLTEQDGFKE